MTRDRGSMSVEVAVLTPAFLMLVALAAVTGRTAIAQNAIDLAAHDAARAASISRSWGKAQDAGKSAALEALGKQGLACTPQVKIEIRQHDNPVGPTATLWATIECEVSFADLALPGVPGSRQLSASFASPLDRYRSWR